MSAHERRSHTPLEDFKRCMATFARATRAQQSAHSSSNTPLATNHLPVIVGSNVQFQYQGIAIIAHFAHLHRGRIVNQRLCDILNESAHILSLSYSSVGVFAAALLCSKRSVIPARLSREATDSVG